MPASAYGILVTFLVLAIVIGIGATWIIGPRRRLAMVLPTLAAFGALYWIGHKSGLELGPSVSMFGFEVAIVQDVVVAIVAAGIVAYLQRVFLTRRAASAGV